MRKWTNVFAVALGLSALATLPLLQAIVAGLFAKETRDWWMLGFGVPALVYLCGASFLVVRFYRRRDFASASSVTAAFCFLLWLTLNTVAGPLLRPDGDAAPDAGRGLLALVAPIVIAVLANRFFQARLPAAFGAAKTG